MPAITRRHLANGMLLASCALVMPVYSAPPVIQGAESVTEWYQQGQKFIRDGEQLSSIRHRAKNVILFVGDGMGISTMTAARILEGQLKGKSGEENRLFFETFPHLGLSKTYSWDQQTSDSAPTMTAMATGYKAREAMLSVDHLTSRGECDAARIAAHSLPTILEQAAAAGKASGIVSTARITHATPAALYAHTAMRDWEHDGLVAAACAGVAEPVKDIARQLIELSPAVRKSLKVALGGGREYFRHNSQNDPEDANRKGLRTDGRDLTAEWSSTRDGNARFVFDAAGFAAVTPTNTDYLLGLFERSHMEYEADRSSDTAGEPSLSEMTEKAIALLAKNKEGYFLHVEGGRIDHAHHAGNARRALLETIELAKAVRTASALSDPRDTLIIVTADHSHTFTIAGYPHRGNNILGLTSEVPSTDGTPPSPAKADDGRPYTTLGYHNGPGAATPRNKDLAGVDTTALDYLQQALIPLKSETHAGEDVAIFARGPKAYLVHGSMEQNWIYHVMKAAFGF
ncbi:alkaline phosphatase [Quatrionicoccus australiensis]|uniref:alkaline phosphatase n=1 Tax=Quatrionicoccus australiensis TaxID=138118 RepID=UPI001CF8B635|nr:alkaline phosphatase [Quatrionicoccus australiensis]